MYKLRSPNWVESRLIGMVADSQVLDSSSNGKNHDKPLRA